LGNERKELSSSPSLIRISRELAEENTQTTKTVNMVILTKVKR